MKSYATYDLPSNVIKLSDEVIPCHVRVCPGAVIGVDLHPPGRLLGRHRRSQIRFCPQGSCVVKAHSTRGRWHVRSGWSSMHSIVRVFRGLLMLPVLGMVIAYPRTRVGLVFNGYMVMSLRNLGLTVRMYVVRLRYWLDGWMWLVMMMVVVVMIFIWLPRNVLVVGLNSWCGHWQRIRLRRGGEL